MPALKPVLYLLIRWLWLLGILTMIMVWGAVGAPAQAETIGEVFCRYICPPLDRGLKKIDVQVRLAWAKWKGRARSMAPPPAPNRGPSCGLLPDPLATTRCCLDRDAKLVIEYVGTNPYAYPDSPWSAVCKRD